MRKLLDDPEYLRAIATAGRQEVEKWGWGAATAKLRKQQYRRAILRNRVYNRLRNFLMKLSVLRAFKALTSAVVGFWTWVMIQLGTFFDGGRPMGGMRGSMA